MDEIRIREMMVREFAPIHGPRLYINAYGEIFEDPWKARAGNWGISRGTWGNPANTGEPDVVFVRDAVEIVPEFGERFWLDSFGTVLRTPPARLPDSCRKWGRKHKTNDSRSGWNFGTSYCRSASSTGQ